MVRCQKYDCFYSTYQAQNDSPHIVNSLKCLVSNLDNDRVSFEDFSASVQAIIDKHDGTQPQKCATCWWGGMNGSGHGGWREVPTR